MCAQKRTSILRWGGVPGDGRNKAGRAKKLLTGQEGESPEKPELTGIDKDVVTNAKQAESGNALTALPDVKATVD